MSYFDTMSSSPMEVPIATQYLTKKEVESVKKEIMDLKGQINHFKALYQSMKEKIAEIKIKNNIDTNSDITEGINYERTTENYISPDRTETSEVIANNASENKINGHNTNHKDNVKPTTQSNGTTEFYDENGIITVPLLYGVIKRNAKNLERNHNGLKEMETNIKQNKIIERKIDESETYMHKKKRACKNLNETENMIPIGSGLTTVPKIKYEKIGWDSYTMATRKLLMAVFPRRILATHSLTGKPSPAFTNKPAKHCLDPKKVADIIYEVTKKCKVKENLVRNAITTKCADENKMMKIQAKKRNITV